MKSDRIRELRELLAKASQRPWHMDGEFLYDSATKDDDDRIGKADIGTVNRELVVAAVNALPELLDENEKLETCRAELFGAFDRMSKIIGRSIPILARLDTKEANEILSDIAALGSRT